MRYPAHNKISLDRFNIRHISRQIYVAQLESQRAIRYQISSLAKSDQQIYQSPQRRSGYEPQIQYQGRHQAQCRGYDYSSREKVSGAFPQNVGYAGAAFAPTSFLRDCVVQGGFRSAGVDAADYATIARSALRCASRPSQFSGLSKSLCDTKSGVRISKLECEYWVCRFSVIFGLAKAWQWVSEGFLQIIKYCR